MELTIYNRKFRSEEINSIVIRNGKVFVDTKEDFYSYTYRKESEIKDARLWQRLQEITLRDVHQAVEMIILVCDAFINTKTQCSECPLHKKQGRILKQIPIDWR